MKLPCLHVELSNDNILRGIRDGLDRMTDIDETHKYRACRMVTHILLESDTKERLPYCIKNKWGKTIHILLDLDLKERLQYCIKNKWGKKIHVQKLTCHQVVYIVINLSLTTY